MDTLTAPAPETYREIVRRALAEDVGTGDVTTESTVPADRQSRGVFVVKADCVLAGIEVALEVFRHSAEKGSYPFFAVHKRDGECCQPGDEIAEVVGSARMLLIGERTALNFLQRLSGIATMARRFSDAAGGLFVRNDHRAFVAPRGESQRDIVGGRNRVKEEDRRTEALDPIGDARECIREVGRQLGRRAVARWVRSQS